MVQRCEAICQVKVHVIPFVIQIVYEIALNFDAIAECIPGKVIRDFAEC